MYSMYEAHGRAMAPWRAAAGLAAAAFRQWSPFAGFPGVDSALAACEVLEQSQLTHERPDWRIGSVEVDGRSVEVTEETVVSTPFASLLHFRKDGEPDQPKVLVLAPMSGHFATLLRQTVQTLLSD